MVAEGDRILVGDLKLTVDTPVARGGFATVFSAVDQSGARVALKVIPKSAGGSRDLLISELGDLEGIMPLLADAEDSNNYYLAMPMADASLREFLSSATGGVSFEDAVSIGRSVARTLQELATRRVVHRDLKPENILRLRDRWVLADFGIARYADATTSDNTLKLAKTAPYAAPEQWREERATPAADAYALGVILYELLTGTLPFLGPLAADFRHQHLNETPTVPDSIPSRIRSLITRCLMKAPGARPSPLQIVEILDSPVPPEGSLADRLATVNARIAATRQTKDAAISAEEQVRQSRALLTSAARESLLEVFSALQNELSSNLTEGSLRRMSDLDWEFHVENSVIGGGAFGAVTTNVLSKAGYGQPFDLVCTAQISIHQPANRFGYEGRAHNLWFCDAYDVGEFRWFETAFMVNPLIPRRFKHNPSVLSPEDAAAALSPAAMGEHQIAWPFQPIDPSPSSDFVTRWLGWFLDSIEGKLSNPSQMPERNPNGSWRVKDRPPSNRVDPNP